MVLLVDGVCGCEAPSHLLSNKTPSLKADVGTTLMQLCTTVLWP